MPFIQKPPDHIASLLKIETTRMPLKNGHMMPPIKQFTQLFTMTRVLYSQFKKKVTSLSPETWA